MTVYIKYENRKLLTAPNKPVEDLLEEGYEASTEEFVAMYFQKQFLQAQIDELDKKRIRAGFEPTLKDETSGQTWLEYYTLQIQDLRDQIAAL